MNAPSYEKRRVGRVATCAGNGGQGSGGIEVGEGAADHELDGPTGDEASCHCGLHAVEYLDDFEPVPAFALVAMWGRVMQQPHGPAAPELRAQHCSVGVLLANANAVPVLRPVAARYEAVVLGVPAAGHPWGITNAEAVRAATVHRLLGARRGEHRR